MIELNTVAPFFADKQDVVAEILGRYPEYGRRSAVMPLLWEVQRGEQHVSEARIAEIADIIGIRPTEVKGVMTFYGTYHEQPVGKFNLQVCATLSCSLAGSDQMFDFLSEELGLVDGETDSEGLFSLRKVECVGSCTTAPVIQVNDTYFEQVSQSRARELLQELRAGNLPEPWRARGGDTAGAQKAVVLDNQPAPSSTGGEAGGEEL
jgi:NADH-quinone oxidoreductase subunit E